jgi:hypothetical protein
MWDDRSTMWNTSRGERPGGSFHHVERVGELLAAAGHIA